MKKILLCCLMIAASNIMMAQTPALIIYAYSRATLPGIPPNTETGEQSNPFPLTYYIYLKVPKGQKIKVEGAWIKGKYFPVSIEKVKSPVMIDDDVATINKKKLTLVGKTSLDVYSLTQAEEKNRIVENENERKKVVDNELVLEYKINDKKGYATIKKFKVLPPAAAM
jgi:hypothetical protein